MSDLREVEALVARGKKIHAIKEFRSLAGVGLKEAKEAVEWYQSHGRWPVAYHHHVDAEPSPPADAGRSVPEPLAPLEQLLGQGKVIHAIKELRSRLGWGLKESKWAVDRYRAQGVWPRQVLTALGVTPASESEASPSPAESLRRELEQLMAQRKKIAAIKRLREITGWGLRETKDAVDHYQAHGFWRSSVLSMLDEVGPSDASPSDASPSDASPSDALPSDASKSDASKSDASPSDEPSSSDASTSADPRQASIVGALTEHLGHAPKVHLQASAYRLPRRGQLVILRDRVCFLYEERGRWVVDPDISYDTVTHVEADTGARPALYISTGFRHERLEMDAGEAEAALALLRVFAG